MGRVLERESCDLPREKHIYCFNSSSVNFIGQCTNTLYVTDHEGAEI